MVYTISQITCIEREWPPFMQWHRIRLTPSYIEYIALATAVPFNTGHPSAVSRSRQLKAALQFFSHYKVPLTFRYSWKRLRKRHSKNLIKFHQVYIAFVLHNVHCFVKKNTYWLNESWETRLPKRLKCTIATGVRLAKLWTKTMETTFRHVIGAFRRNTLPSLGSETIPLEPVAVLN